MEHTSAVCGPIKVVIYWESKFRKVGRALDSWFGDRSTGEARSCIEFVVSPAMFDEVSRVDAPQSSIRTWAWDAVPVSSVGGYQLWICKPRITTKKWIARFLPEGFMRFANSSRVEIMTKNFCKFMIVNGWSDMNKGDDTVNSNALS